MAGTGRVSALVVVVLAVAAASSSFRRTADAQSSSSCTSVLATMAPCLNYITGNSTTPSSSCCSQLSSVVSSNAQCLCLVLNGTAASSFGIIVNQTQTLELPRACNVQTPSLSSCNGVTGEAPSPASSDGSPATVSFSLLCLLLCVASSTSSFNTLVLVVMDV